MAIQNQPLLPERPEAATQMEELTEPLKLHTARAAGKDVLTGDIGGLSAAEHN
ncbi:hypothetical protein [Aeoliella sp.]|uniref:hypothetical protein n=1 Tax=Aeoliella sp. TaxID=2795800 RepID=UPI003CCBA43C